MQRPWTLQMHQVCAAGAAREERRKGGQKRGMRRLSGSKAPGASQECGRSDALRCAAPVKREKTGKMAAVFAPAFLHSVK